MAHTFDSGWSNAAEREERGEGLNQKSGNRENSEVKCSEKFGAFARISKSILSPA